MTIEQLIQLMENNGSPIITLETLRNIQNSIQKIQEGNNA